MTATILMSATLTPASSQQQRILRYGNTSGWSFDMRDDDRDSPGNGFFPGNFAASPSVALIGAAGLLESNPRRSAAPYPSQVVFGSPAGDHAHRIRRTYFAPRPIACLAACPRWRDQARP